MTSATSRQHLAHRLDLEIEASQRLLENLQLEHQALTARDAKALAQVTAAKHAGVEAYERLAQERDQLLTKLGLPLGKEGIEKELQEGIVTADDALALAWKRLQRLAEKCWKQNRINGRLAELGGRHLQRALDILCGHTAAVRLYDPQGQTEKARRSHPLGRV